MKKKQTNRGIKPQLWQYIWIFLPHCSVELFSLLLDEQEEENSGNTLGDINSKEHKNPRRVIYFANGESMEDYSTEEDDIEENNTEPLLNTVR